jgi:hypothetical protein
VIFSPLFFVVCGVGIHLVGRLSGKEGGWVDYACSLCIERNGVNNDLNFLLDVNPCVW